MISRIDWSMVAIMAAILAIGAVNVWSASYISHSGDYAGFGFKQLFWIGLGGVLYVALLAIPYQKTSRWSYLFYGGCLAGLAATFVIGKTISGSRRWIALGPFNCQPSEFVKLALVMTLARCLTRRDLSSPGALAMPCLIALIPALLVARQPDLGTALVFVPVLVAMLFVAGMKRSHLIVALLLAVHLVPIGYFFFLESYQRARVTSFLFPGSLTKEQREGQAYQGIQSLIAVGSGGLFGKGWGEGTQNRLNFLPERHNDFIFAVVAEEWGFAGAGLLLLLYAGLFLRILQVAARNREPYGRLLCVGVVALTLTQVFVNAAMAMGLAPITGLSLPLVSYGGSSLLTFMAALSLATNVAARPGHDLGEFGVKNEETE